MQCPEAEEEKKRVKSVGRRQEKKECFGGYHCSFLLVVTLISQCALS